MSISVRNPNLLGLISKIYAVITSPVFRRVEIVVIFVFVISLFIHRINVLSFFSDESTWIRYSSYFDVLVRGDLSADTWSVNKVLVDQPPLAPYLIGLGRLLGHQPTLDAIWKYSQSDSYNLAQGALPAPDLLWWSRLPMVILAAVAGDLIFIGVCFAAGRLAGYFWIFFYCVSPYMSSTLGRAMAESPLLAAVVVAGLAGGYAFHYLIKSFAGPQVDRQAYKRSLFGWALMGIASGLAASAKLNGIVIIGASFICFLAPLVASGLTIPWSDRFRRVIISGLVLLCTTTLTFILINPFLYRNTVSRGWMLLTHRLTVIQSQERDYSSAYIDTWAERFQVVPDEIFNQHAFSQFPGSFWLNLGLSAIGLGLLIATARRWRSNDPAAVSSFMLLAATFTVGIPPLLTPLNWDRYYLLPIVFIRIFTVVAVAKIITRGFAFLFPALIIKPQPLQVQ